MHLVAHAEMTPSGRAADAPQQVHRRALGDGEQRAGDVAVGDQPHAGAGVADGLDARPRGAARSSTTAVTSPTSTPRRSAISPTRLAQVAVEVEQVGDLLAAGHLLHVDARARVEHRPLLGERDHRERARHAQRAQARALERVDGDVDRRRRAVADVLAVVRASAPRPSRPRRSRRRRPCGSSPRTACMPSTAAWSAAILSPRPTQRAACSAAASVTRTSSRARLRSGVAVPAIGSAGAALVVTGRRAACGGARTALARIGAARRRSRARRRRRGTSRC